VTLLEIEALGIDVVVGGTRREIVRDVSLTLAEGEAVGLVGESGSGKSMTLRAILRLLPRAAGVRGRVEFDGVDVLGMQGPALRAYLSREVATVFQNPQSSINPLLRVGDFICEPLVANGGMSRRAARDLAVAMLEEVGVTEADRRMNQRPHELSGGMLQRVMIAAALVGEPRLLLADEPTTALDVTTQEEVMAILSEQRTERGLAMIFVTHDLDLATAVCDRIAVMYAGTLVEQTAADRVYSDARHPYTSALMASRPGLGLNDGRLVAIPGRPVAAYEAAEGCPFNPRCPRATDVCRVERPALEMTSSGSVACFHPLVPLADDVASPAPSGGVHA
jgi:oligopeptide/dipeptide ABC transporter ATP-binding protein